MKYCFDNTDQKTEKYADPQMYFSELYKIHGIDEKSLGWSKHKQKYRFDQVSCHINNGESVLDVGCGFGDLNAYFREKKIDVEYYGIDIMEDFIKIATENNVIGATKFACADIDTLPWSRRWDWIVECGLFGLRQFDDVCMYDYINAFVQKAMKLTDTGIAMNFLSDKIDYRTSDIDFHAKPEKVLDIAYGYSRRIVLDNSIMPFEFCVTIWKDDGFSKDTTVFDGAI